MTTYHLATTKIPHPEHHNTCLSARQRACHARDKQKAPLQYPHCTNICFTAIIWRSYMPGGREPGQKGQHGTPETKWRCWGGGRREKRCIYTLHKHSLGGQAALPAVLDRLMFHNMSRGDQTTWKNQASRGFRRKKISEGLGLWDSLLPM